MIGSANQGGAVVAGSVVSPRVGSVADCDRWLAVLRVSVRRGAVEDRELARLLIDDVLDRRLELARSERKGATK